MTTPQPTQRDLDEAMQVLASTDRTYQRYGFSEDKLPRLTGSIALALAARDAEWREKCKAFLDESGEPRKVLEECTAGNGVYKIGEMLCANELEKGETVVVLAAAEAARKEGV